jgi:stage V sporulation protein AC
MQNKMTNEEYQKYVDKKTPNSTLLKDIALAFLVGGLICIIGQLIFDGYSRLDMSEDIARMGTSATLIFLVFLIKYLSAKIIL